MKASLKLLVLLLCVHRLKSHSDRRRAARANAPVAERRGKSGGERAAAPARPRRSAPASACGLRSIPLQVRDLGLGYDSRETVLFKYCGGTCPRVPSNHDLTLANLQLSGVLPPPAARELWLGAPCCRPTHHEDMAFLDDLHRWHKVEKLSAAGCGCVG